MSERVEVYDLDSHLHDIQDRDEFYKMAKDEFKETGAVTKKLKNIYMILLNSRGRILLQKRSRFKSENAGLYDKSIGGHVKAGDMYDLSAIKECVEELGIPVTVLSEMEFKSAVKITDTSVIGILKKLDYIDTYESKRVNKEDGSVFVQPYMTTVYIGYFDGFIKFIDGETSGVETFSLEELQGLLETKPEEFTSDLKYLIDNYAEHIVPLKK